MSDNNTEATAIDQLPFEVVDFAPAPETIDRQLNDAEQELMAALFKDKQVAEEKFNIGLAMLVRSYGFKKGGLVEKDKRLFLRAEVK
jgi:hypothetical protein